MGQQVCFVFSWGVIWACGWLQAFCCVKETREAKEIFSRLTHKTFGLLFWTRNPVLTFVMVDIIWVVCLGPSRCVGYLVSDVTASVMPGYCLYIQTEFGFLSIYRENSGIISIYGSHMANIIIMPFRALSDHLCFMERNIVIVDDIAPSGDEMNHGII